MVYKNQFVAVIKHGSQILRESRSGQEDVIQIPFGSEYSIHLKNLSSNRAAISVSIDDVDVLNGHRIVLGANETHDLEGFMENGVIKNRFKFIQKTQEIADHRGDFIDDGIVRVSYQFEKPSQPITSRPILWDNPYWPYGHDLTRAYGSPYGSSSGDALMGDSTEFEHKTSCLRGGPIGQSLGSSETFSKGGEARALPQPDLDEGITVKGSQTNVNYSNTYLNELYPEVSVITFKLVGYSRNNVKIAKPVTVRKKIHCPTCGRHNSSRYDFCTNCGTCLK